MIIGLTGAAGCGKDTVANILARRGFESLAFADPIYKAVAAITGLSQEELRDRSRKETPIPWLGKSPRELLQTLGTEWGRDMVRQDIWIRVAMQQASAIARCVITDVRFENEAAAIKTAGGRVWRIVRPESCLTDQAAKHSSEAGIPNRLVDLVVQNNSTIEALVARVEAAFVIK